MNTSPKGGTDYGGPLFFTCRPGDFDFRGLLKWDFQSCKLVKAWHGNNGLVGSIGE
jgi:hypothetical protein